MRTLNPRPPTVWLALLLLLLLLLRLLVNRVLIPPCTRLVWFGAVRAGRYRWVCRQHHSAELLLQGDTTSLGANRTLDSQLQPILFWEAAHPRSEAATVCADGGPQ